MSRILERRDRQSAIVSEFNSTIPAMLASLSDERLNMRNVMRVLVQRSLNRPIYGSHAGNFVANFFP
jgi:hypothetical protein